MQQRGKLLTLAAFALRVVATDRIEAVRAVFRRSWDGYRQYAWGHDSLRPLTNGYYDDRNGWGASAVDALSTAIIMGEEEAVQQILEYIPTIDFATTSTEVSLFETTIRYLGGMLSGYDLLRGPYKDMAPSEEAIESLLSQSVRLADLLKVAFNTESGVPDNDLLFDPEPRRKGTPDNWIATIGTLVLEWERLSDLTGNIEYGELAKGAESYLLRPPPEAEPFPGMIGSRLWVENGTFVDSMGGWNGGTDSFYEYLIKMYIYDPVRFESYKYRHVFRETLYFYSSHLACFNGGNFILGGLVLDEPRYVDFGLELTAGCHESYIQTVTAPPESQIEFYDEAGFWIINAQYSLRPEVIESCYYAYRATGNIMYREWAWDAFVKINATSSAGSGVSSVLDVQRTNGTLVFWDFQDSFWFSEVLKYMYLILLDEDSEVHVKKGERGTFVYNTEAHPIRIFES
ncbi:unnamed protein product [Parascedosporium putredinis]|uniref:alpha-1,2-Mannosidase n=1 Tax=Parascedosporium putredinis TaxID=1442378 RepID=A0A9P1HCU8_9PEZI|nr:unnamed protein product [Parascedosporium putredinis]CAI8003707.1 unnamed protein product [Parascedosporium putredinis]